MDNFSHSAYCPYDGNAEQTTEKCGRNYISRSLYEFERQVIVFPLLVVVLTCASFFVGGKCTAWQWWISVAIVLALPVFRRVGWQTAIGAFILFTGFLMAIKGLVPPLLWDDVSCGDMPIYHLPMVQLLVEGWNPVADPLAKEVVERLGVDLWGMGPLHVAFLPKTMAIFSAVAYTFVKDPTALFFPGVIFLWTGVALQVARLYRGLVRVITFAALFLCFLEFHCQCQLIFVSHLPPLDF